MVDWKSIEMLGYHYYAEKGFRILIPLVKANDYDFVTEYYSKFKRINVKVAGLKTKIDPNSWSISISGGKVNSDYWKKKVNKSCADIYLVWLPHQKRFIELNGNFFQGSKSKSKLIPKEYLQEGQT